MYLEECINELNDNRIGRIPHENEDKNNNSIISNSNGKNVYINFFLNKN